MNEGSIGKWIANEGAKIKDGNIIATIDTDKASVDFEVTENFILVKKLYKEGEKLQVGQVIAIAAEDEDEYKKLKDRDFSE